MISIIVIVKNDRGIINTLSALSKIDKPSITEVVVIDASEGNLDDIKIKFPSVKWFYFNNKYKKNITISEQRNMGVKYSSGDIIIFLDANCVPINNWLDELIKPVIEDRESIVAGNVKPFDTKTVNTISDERFKGKNLSEAPTINLLLKREIFDKIGYFDENLSYCEDVDLTWRALDSGYNIRYAKGAIVFHDWGNFRNQIKRTLAYGELRVILYKKYPNKLKEIYKNENIIVLIYPLFIILLPLILIFPYYPLLIFIPIIKNIKHHPFKTVLLNIFFGFGVLKGAYLHVKHIITH